MCKASRRDVLTGVLGLTASQAFLFPALTKSAAAQELPQNAAAIVAAIRAATGLALNRVPVRPTHLTGT